MDDHEVARLRKYLETTSLPMLHGSVPGFCDWEVYSGNPNDLTVGVIYRAYVKDWGYVYKHRSVITGLSAQQLFEEFINDKEMPKWIPNLEFSKVIDNGKDDWFIAQQLAKGMGVSDRDFVSIRFRGNLENGGIYMIGCSPPKEKCPVPPLTKGCVRGEQLPNGLMFEPYENNPNRCIFTNLVNMDFKGYVPKAIINFATPKVVVNLGIAAQKRALAVNKQLAESKCGENEAKANSITRRFAELQCR